MVSWLPQRPSFVHGTVGDNLRLGNPDAQDSELWAALDQVALADRVRRMGGLEASLAEDGRSLSAGERARLALVRVLVAKRPWVLLDEPTAHLDPVTEHILADVVLALAQTSSVVVVAHRQTFVDLADRVIRIPEPRSQVSASETGVRVPTRPSPARVTERAEPAVAKRTGLGLSTFLGTMASLCGVALTATAGWLIVKAAEQPAVLTMLVAIVSVRAFGLGRPIFRYAERLRSHDVALRQLAQRRVQVYDAIVPLTPGRLGKRRGDVLASIVDDVESVVDRQLRVRLPIRTWALVSIIASMVAALLLPEAGLILAGASLLAGAVGSLIARVGSVGPEKRLVAARGDLSSLMVEVAQLAPELLMWQAGASVERDVSAIGDRLADAGRRVALSAAAARALLVLVSGMAVAAIAYVGAPAVTSGILSGPMLAMLVLMPLALLDVSLPVVEAGALAGRTQAADQRLLDLESLAPAVEEPLTPESLPDGREVVGDRLALGWNGSVVLDGLDLTLAPGTNLGVIGPSGSGKSTLAAALVRFVDPVSGVLRLDGVDLACLALDDVRRTVGYVDDDPHVFATTLVENIRLARPEATDHEVEVALRSAHLGRWLDDLPDGLQTWLGSGHADVSGGERARLGLARSLLLGQPILVLDEPTAHLDQATATAVADDLMKAAHGRTLVWITHSDIGLDRMDDILDLSPTRSPRQGAAAERLHR